MNSRLVDTIKNLAAVLPFITIAAYGIAFGVLSFYLFDIKMPYNIIATLTVSDYVVMFVMVFIISIYITYILCQPILVLTDLYSNNLAVEYNEVDINKLEKVINKLLCVWDNKWPYIFNTIFSNLIFAVVLTIVRSDYKSFKWLYVLPLALLFKYLLDLLFSLIPKITAVIVVVVVLLLMIYKADYLVEMSGYGNIAKFIVTSEKPDLITNNILGFNEINIDGSKIFITRNKIHLGLITKENYYIKINSVFAKDFIKLPTDTYSLFSGLTCNMCHKSSY